MELGNLIKVIAAFIAGVVVALGSALIYVRVNETSHPQSSMARTALETSTSPAVENSTPATGQDAADQEPASEPAQPPTPAAAPRDRAKKLKPLMEALGSNRHVNSTRISTVPAKQKPPNAPIEIAQNTAPAAPATQIPGVNSTPAIPGVNPQTSIPGVNPEPQNAPEQPVQQPSGNPPPPSPENVRQPHVVTLQAGTNLVIRLGETLSTDHNYTGDTFRATLEVPIIMDGFIIADKGSKVLGRVINAQKPGHLEGVADLNLALTEINTTDGQRVRIETSAYDKRGPSNTGQDVAKIAGGAALGAVIGGIAGGGKGAAIGAGAGGAAGTGAVMITHGKPAMLPTETRLTFRLANPVTIAEKLNY